MVNGIITSFQNMYYIVHVNFLQPLSISQTSKIEIIKNMIKII
jgi:hypothetical protein